VKPTPDDLRALAVPLIAVSAGLQRTLRGSADSSALAILASAAQRDNVRPSDLRSAGKRRYGRPSRVNPLVRVLQSGGNDEIS
jgi:hypothetical protein